MSEEWDLLVSKMANIAKVNDIPVITGLGYFSAMTLGKDRTHSEYTKRGMHIYASMFEDAVSAAWTDLDLRPLRASFSHGGVALLRYAPAAPALCSHSARALLGLYPCYA